MGAATTEPALIAIDWGTTNVRAALLDGAGRVLAESASDEGIGSVPAGGHADRKDFGR